jgi:hypothetical protein
VTFHLKPEIQAKLVAHAAALGVSVDEYLQALVEREVSTLPEPLFTGGEFQKEHGIWVYRTGDPMPLNLADETLETMRREREIDISETLSK